MSQKTALLFSSLLTVFILFAVSFVAQALTAIAAIEQPPPGADTALQLVINDAANQQPAPVVSQISGDQATTLARKLAPGATLQNRPELVNFQGQVAYEVVLDQGKVYIDANTGAVLSNGVAPQTAGPVNLDQAVQIAESYMKEKGDSSQLAGVRFGQARGMQLFEVTFDDQVQIYVNADSGEVAIVRTPRG